ncbi:MAG: flippase-like domain-containing protein [Solirubrobacterales bacterium]|nr:flippase-like domain-containing protein [Solirubrobacterales bacterium]
MAGPEEQLPQLPRIRLTRRQVALAIAFIIAVIAFLYLGLPKLAGLGRTIDKLKEGNIWWLALAVVCELGSYLGYMALFRGVFVNRAARIGWAASYQITLAGEVASRVLAAGGAGGAVLTVWALRRAGMGAREVADRMVAFLVLLYAAYMLSLLIDGLGLFLHLWPGQAPLTITLIPAAFGFAVIVLFLAIGAIPGNFERLVARWSAGSGVVGKVARRLATVPASAGAGVRTAIRLLRGGDPALLGSIGNWAGDIACLWACFHAFGAAPPLGVVVMAYFVGWIANLLPLPGGIGGVEGGLIGCFSAFDVNVQSAIVAVLAYRAFSFWAPIVPGLVAYLQLRGTVNRWDAQESLS